LTLACSGLVDDFNEDLTFFVFWVEEIGSVFNDVILAWEARAFDVRSTDERG
jgi:hypothetical protein